MRNIVSVTVAAVVLSAGWSSAVSADDGTVASGPIDQLCPSGWYPGSYETLKAQDASGCVPFEPCIDGTLLYGLAPCNPFIDPADPIPVLDYDGNTIGWTVYDNDGSWTYSDSRDGFVTTAEPVGVAPNLPVGLDVVTIGPLVEPPIAG